MTVRKAFRFRLEPTPEQTHVMARVAGCVRFVWHKGFIALISAPGEALVIVARTRDEGESMATYQIAVIPGDGIGQEVMPEGMKALRAVQQIVPGLHLEFAEFPWGSDY